MPEIETTETTEYYDTLDVTGIDPAALLAALHNNTETPNTDVCLAQTIDRDLTVEEAQVILDKDMEVTESKENYYFFTDYVLGRPIKAMLRDKYVKDESDPLGRYFQHIYLVRCNFYDRDAGEGKAKAVVEQLRAEAYNLLAPNVVTPVTS